MAKKRVRGFKGSSFDALRLLRKRGSEGSRVQVSGVRMLDTKCCLDTGYRLQDTRFKAKTQDSRYRLQALQAKH